MIKYEVQRYLNATNDYEILATRNDKYWLTIICNSQGVVFEMDIWNDLFEEFEGIPLNRKKSEWYVERLNKLKTELLDVISIYKQERTG